MAFVNMPVKCLGENCKKCPRLDIQKDSYLMMAADQSQHQYVENVLCCEHWQECAHAYDQGLNDARKEYERIKNIAYNEERHLGV